MPTHQFGGSTRVIWADNAMEKYRQQKSARSRGIELKAGFAMLRRI